MIHQGARFICMLLLSFVLWPQAAIADNVEIVKTSFTKQGETWLVDVTLRHADTGWQHYVDAWRIVDETSKELAKRVLWHPHVNEQPFSRSLQQVNIPADVSIVYIEAHDSQHGWSPQKLKVDLTRHQGKNFVVNK